MNGKLTFKHGNEWQVDLQTCRLQQWSMGQERVKEQCDLMMRHIDRA